MACALSCPELDSVGPFKVYKLFYRQPERRTGFRLGHRPGDIADLRGALAAAIDEVISFE